MKIPKKYERFLTGTYEQGDEISKRFRYYRSLLENAMQVLTTDEKAYNPTTQQLLRKNDELQKNAHACLQGACQCLSIKWLKIKMKEQIAAKTGKNKVKPDDRLELLRDPVRLDKVVEKMRVTLGTQTFIDSFAEAMNQFNVAAKPHWNGSVPLANLCKTVSSQTHAYFVVGIRCPKLEGNHAIAVYTSDGGFLGTGKHAHVFDPNIGEIKLPLSDFSTLFPGLIDECYGTGPDDVLLFAELVK